MFLLCIVILGEGCPGSSVSTVFLFDDILFGIVMCVDVNLKAL